MSPDAVGIPHLDAARHVSYAVQLSLGVVFTASAIPKLRRPATLVRSVGGYGLVPKPLVRATAFTVVAAETVLAAAFLTGWLLVAAIPVAAAMLGCFLAAVGVNLARGRRVHCGCFGGEGDRISARSLVRIGLLLAAVAVLAVTPSAPVTPGTLADEGVAALGYLVQAGGLAFFLVLAATWLLSFKEVGYVLGRLRPARRAVEPRTLARAEA